MILSLLQPHRNLSASILSSGPLCLHPGCWCPCLRTLEADLTEFPGDRNTRCPRGAQEGLEKMNLMRTGAALVDSGTGSAGGVERGAGIVGGGSLGQLQIPARLCRAKWRRPIRAACVITAPSADCTLTLGWEDGRGLGSGSWSRLRPQPGRESRPTPVLGRRAWPGTLPHPSLQVGGSRGQGCSGGLGPLQVKDLLWLPASDCGNPAQRAG